MKTIMVSLELSVFNYKELSQEAKKKTRIDWENELEFNYEDFIESELSWLDSKYGFNKIKLNINDKNKIYFTDSYDDEIYLGSINENVQSNLDDALKNLDSDESFQYYLDNCADLFFEDGTVYNGLFSMINKKYWSNKYIKEINVSENN